MRWVVAIFFVYLVLPFVAWAQWGKGSDCPSFPQVRVSVITSVANPVYDFSTSIPDVQSLANDVVHQIRMGWALGFTQTQPMLEMDAPVDAMPGENGQYCARPRYVNITLGTRSETITIPRDIPPESCGFREVMEHEEKHQQANWRLARKLSAATEQEFAEYFKYTSPIRAGSAEEATAAQQNALRFMLDDIAAKMITENAMAQQDIDAPGEYERLLHACNGELADIVKRARDERYAQRW